VKSQDQDQGQNSGVASASFNAPPNVTTYLKANKPKIGEMIRSINDAATRIGELVVSNSPDAQDKVAAFQFLSHLMGFEVSVPQPANGELRMKIWKRGQPANRQQFNSWIQSL
jgi:hypothetical protein